MNEVSAFMFYMYNKWNVDEAKELFGYDLGEHIYNKYLTFADELFFYGSLDKECQQKLVDRAKEFYL